MLSGLHSICLESNPTEHALGWRDRKVWGPSSLTLANGL